MRTSRPTLTLLAAFAALGGLLSSVNAQSVATQPVGAVTTTLPTGFSLVGLTLLNASSYSGAASGNTATAITAAGSVNFASALQAGSFYYVEVTSGAYEGDRFDVNVATTISSASNVLTLRTDTGNNTVALTDGVLNGASFVLRRHITLNDFASKVSPALTGNNSSTNADQVLFFNRSTSTFDTYFLRTDGVTWRQVGFTDSVGASTIIPPGVGIFVRKASASSTLTQIGDVRSNHFALPLGTGLTLVAAGYPTSYSPSGLGGTAANGWFGNNGSANADQLLTYNNSTSSYVTYFLRTDGIAWREVGFTTDVKDVQVIPFDSAFWVKRNSADVNYALVKPF